MSSIALGLIFAAAANGSAVAARPVSDFPDPPPIVRHQLEEGSSKRAAYEAYQRDGRAGLKSWADPPGPATFDVLHYDLDLHVDVSRRVLSGTVSFDLASLEDGLTTVTLDADLALRVLSVIQLGDQHYPYDSPAALAFSHVDNRLAISLARPLAAGEEIRLQVVYGGRASRDGLIGATGVNWSTSNGAPVIHTFAQPYGARVWWPCNDRPDDKATVTMRVTVPANLDVSSNGLERSRVDNDDGTATSVWSSEYPVPTYLVVMHVSDFIYSEQTYTALDGATTMPVGLWAMPQLADQAEADLAITVPQIEVMAGHWGEYPFLNEKYGNATMLFGGGMEHQTMTTLSAFYVGDPWMQWLNVHELGHQWWGDWVTMNDWRDTWLNEGFATHTEWLWAEHLGPDVLAQYLEEEDYLGQFRGPLYDNPEPFSWTIYAKGSWVAWMLRHVVGDDAFFDAMAAYRAAGGGGTATTEDLESAMEAAADTELDWFFDQWVYGRYRPRYVYSWEAVNGPAVELTVRQEQTNTGLFRMPMDIRVTTASGVEDHRVWFDDEAEQIIEIALQNEATGVEIDPDTRVLCEIAHHSEPDLELGPLFPDGYEFGTILSSDTTTRGLPLTNVGGADLVIRGVIPTTGRPFRFENPPEFPLTIAPGATETLEIVFDPSGLGPQSAWLLIESNDPDREGVAYIHAQGAAAHYSQAFLGTSASANAGRVPLGGTGEARFDAINLGLEPLPITAVVDGAGFEPASTLPPILEPGRSYEVFVRFHPTVVGAASGSVSFYSGDPNQPLKVVVLSGIGESAPRLELNPAALNLGVGDGSATASLLAINSGTEDLVVSRVDVEPPFSLEGSEAVVYTIPPGASSVITIGLDGASDGTHDGHLALHSNDPSIPVALVALRAHVTDNTLAESSFPAVANGPGIGDTHWSTTAFLLNPTSENLRTDLVYRPTSERTTAGVDMGLEVPARSQRVIADVVGLLGSSGSGGLNLRSDEAGMVAISRTFAAGGGGTYGQFIAAEDDADALIGDSRYVLVGLSGNGGFHTNIGVLNHGDKTLDVDFQVFDGNGELLGTRRLTARPGAFKQGVSVISDLSTAIVRGGYATLTAVDSDARFLAYASVVDDGSHDPTLALPYEVGSTAAGVDLIVPAAASTMGSGGTNWHSQLTVVNTSSESRSVTIEYAPESGSSIASMPMDVAPNGTLHFDDVVSGLFGESGKGWLRVAASGDGVHAAARTYNDDTAGTYGQLIPAYAADAAAGENQTVVIPGLSSAAGFRTNLGLTSIASEDATCTVSVFGDDGASIGVLDLTLPAGKFIQVERLLGGRFEFTGTAWAEVRCGTGAGFFAHASVVDGQTGDPTYVPGVVIQ